LEHAIARNMQALRVERGWTQSDLAMWMRQTGFTWQTNRVTQLETLRRPVSLLEILGLAWVFGVPVAHLLSGEDRVRLPNGDSEPLSALREALTVGGDGAPHVVDADVVDETAAAEALRNAAKRLGMPAVHLNYAARLLWDRSFMAERERRLGEPAGGDRSVRTRRGHVTRALISELSDYLAQPGRREEIMEGYVRDVGPTLARLRHRGQNER
jgi:hypothetical protein